MIAETLPTNQAGLAFDTLAENYDERFTQSQIGRAQRNVVWRAAETVFRGNMSILELNCGTGEDALFLASRGHTVTALDASRTMINCASIRKENEAPHALAHFRLLPTERLDTLPSINFGAVFSNFSGLNCVEDLHEVANQLSQRTLPGAPLLLCFSTRVCLWETIWFLLQGSRKKATRRWSGHSTASLNGVNVTVHYPTVREIVAAFAPHFTLVSSTGIGIYVPPSYVEPWMQNHSLLLAAMIRADRIVCRLPVLRALGDHILLHFVRVAERAQ